LRAFSIVGALADANGFGKPHNNIAAADAPSNELHHESTNAAGFFNAVDMRDVRMIERRERLRFAREPHQPIRIVRKRVREDFERDLAIELGIARPIHLPHPAFADRGRDRVDGETRAGE